MRLRCWALDDEMLKILSFLHERSVKLAGHKDGETHMLQASKLYFLEAVDGKTFVYTKELVLEVPQGLAQQVVLPDNAKTNPRGFLWIKVSFLITLIFAFVFGWFMSFPLWCFFYFYF